MKRIAPTHGPFAGQHIDVDDADADAAIADRWAVDPFATLPTDAPAAFTQEEYDAMMSKAEKAARKLRGEPEPGQPAEGSEKRKPGRPAKKDSDASRPLVTDDMKAETTTRIYKTRDLESE